MNEHHLSSSRLFVAGFLLFLVVFGGLIGGVGPLVARFFGDAKAAEALLVWGLGTGIGGGLILGLLLAGMGRTKTICLSTRDPSALQLAHECLAKQGYTVFAQQAPSGTTYCAEAAAQTYAQVTASHDLYTRLLRFVLENICGIMPAAFFVHVTEQGDGLQVSGPAQCVRKVERDLRTHGVEARQGDIPDFRFPKA
jgi:hypothetical protein